MEWPTPRHTDHWTHAATVGGRGLTDARREQRAEAAEAREADLHADVRHRVLAGREQVPGKIEARRQTELVRRDTEQRLELTDEMKRRDAYFAREILDRQWMLALFEQQLASAAEPAEPLMSEQHSMKCSWVMPKHETTKATTITKNCYNAGIAGIAGTPVAQRRPRPATCIDLPPITHAHCHLSACVNRAAINATRA